MKNQLLLERGALLGAFFIISLALLGYVKNLHGFFILDDYPNFYGLRFVEDYKSAINYVLTAPAGERWISYASFLIHIDAWNNNQAYDFKLFNLLIHIVNTGLVFIVLRKLPKERFPALSTTTIILISALWFAHPIHVNAVLYSVQRMTLLACLFVLLGLLYQQVLLNSYRAKERLKVYHWLFFSMGLAFITILGVLSKESAILLPALAFLLLQYSNQRHCFSGWQKLITYASPYVVLFLYLILANKLSFVGRDFNMGERLLSQVLILKEYVIKIAIPNTKSFSLYYDGFIPVRNIGELRFIGAVLFWGLIWGAAFYLKRKAPYILFGFLWFFVAHALESSIIPLELYFDHRNYLPSLGILLILVLGGKQFYLYCRQNIKTLIGKLVILLVLVLTVNFLWLQHYETSLWSEKARFEKEQIIKQPNSLRAAQGYTEVLITEGQLVEANNFLEYMHGRFGYYPTHIIYQAIIACYLQEDDKINQQEILHALSYLPADKSVSEAMQAMLGLVKDETCNSFSLPLFEQYINALLNNHKMSSHSHNLVFLLVQAYLDSGANEQALKASYLLADKFKTKQFWFIQIGMAVGLEEKKAAKQLYDAMIESHHINKVLYGDEVKEIKKSIERLSE